ncbi:S1/P1 nuclease [Sphingomonas sp. LB-2]|uniref:S1/P1 nuclease n=1 Tax=Sphingomonas caeni TaxID=2984949 RepID=UPI002231B5F8|nr:S1/P1 nuclease [Sphingomonas caeni]MCW3846223.1 S1/P1 nuclease [Sphingomonas caeni]
MIRRILPLLAALAALLPSPAMAYWEFGHETVAAIAYRNVTPQVRAAIDRMLARSALMQTPKCPARTIEEASIWADCIKTLGPRFSYAFSWHYQNVNICKPFDLKGACKDGNCVSAQIDRDVKILKDAGIPLSERIQALAFLVHFVGDLHQPLHAGDRGDLGGNQVKAAYGIYAPERFNLHSVWDGPLAERAITDGPPLVRAYSDAERGPVWIGTTEDWSRENWQVAHDFAYATAAGGDPCGPLPPRAVLDDATIAKLVPPARLQVLRGGLRLARLLDEALGS